MKHLQAAIEDCKRLERHDPVNHPLHYAEGAIECIDAVEVAIQGMSGMEAHLTACCIKYLWRWRKKNGVEDLQKCKAYLERLIDIALVSNAQKIGPDYEVLK